MTWLCATELAIANSPYLPPFVLEDQYKRQWTTKDFASGVTVFVISDRNGYEYTNNWLEPLLARFRNSIRFVAVADVQAVPGFLKGLIRARFRESFSYPILMDWDGILINALNVTSGYPNLVIIGQNGRIVYSTYGKGSKEQIERISQKLQAAINTD